MQWDGPGISYVRFSSTKQEQGDSVRRQDDAALDLCFRHGLTLDTTLTFRDLGVSAFRSKNATKGDLGVFLAAVKAGRIPTGSTLILERIDRLTRDEPMEQMKLIDLILKSGIRIATPNPDRFYTSSEVSANPYLLYEILSHAMRGWEESNTKSVRVKESWARKRKAAEERQVPMTKKCAPWLKLRKDRSGFDEIPERVDLVRRIYLLAESGQGAQLIAKKLNSEGIKSFQGKIWRLSYLGKLLSDRRVLGEMTLCQFENEKKIPVGISENYYPAIIDADQFARVQTGRSSRRSKRGPVEKWRTNVFRGMLFDARSGLPVGMKSYVNHGLARIRLVVRLPVDTGEGQRQGFLYEPFEAAFFKFITDLKPADFGHIADKEAGRLATLSSRLAVTVEKIAITESTIAETEDARVLPRLLKTQTDLELQMLAIKKELDGLRMQTASPSVEGVAETQTLVGMLATSPDPDSLRLRIRARLRQLVREVWIHTYDKDNQRQGVCMVVFHEGTYRLFRTGYSLNRKPFTGVEHGTEHHDNLTVTDFRNLVSNLGQRPADSDLKHSRKPV